MPQVLRYRSCRPVRSRKTAQFARQPTGPSPPSSVSKPTRPDLPCPNRQSFHPKKHQTEAPPPPLPRHASHNLDQDGCLPSPPSCLFHHWSSHGRRRHWSSSQDRRPRVSHRPLPLSVNRPPAPQSRAKQGEGKQEEMPTFSPSSDPLSTAADNGSVTR